MKPSKKILAIILAAGQSKRFKSNKLFFEIDGKPVLQRTIENINGVDEIMSILIVGNKQNKSDIKSLLDQIKSKKQVYSISGGNSRADSLVCAINFINENKLLFAEGNAIKYICRHSSKGKEKDIEKAIHYLEMILERDYS